MLTQIAACEELFHTATGTAFADLLVDGHRETWPIRSKRFRGWLRRRYYEATGGALTGQAISSELDLLEARAQFDAPRWPRIDVVPRAISAMGTPLKAAVAMDDDLYQAVNEWRDEAAENLEKDFFDGTF